MTKYIRMIETLSRDRVTVVYGIYAMRSGTCLGEIKWYGAWRQYTFWPHLGTIWNPDCLREVADKCAELTRDHRKALSEEGGVTT